MTPDGALPATHENLGPAPPIPLDVAGEAAKMAGTGPQETGRKRMRILALLAATACLVAFDLTAAPSPAIAATSSQSDTNSDSGGDSGHQCERRKETPTS